MKKHINVPVFIPHLGCPNDCVFCNQRSISGKKAFDASSVESEIDTALSSVVPGSTEVEIAFFGGSFTAIDRGLMVSLLQRAQKYINNGSVSSIRISTRPDAIDSEILDILAEYNVTDIELGIQSMSDHVLKKCNRGHTSADTVKACALIKEAGFNLVGQMMVGLPGSDTECERETARQIVALGCTGARIYPLIVLKDTPLASQLASGEYTPLTEEQVLERGAAVLDIFEANAVKVLRIGLCAEEGLDDSSALSGSFDPAIGEKIQSRLYLKKIEALISKKEGEVMGETLYINCPVGAVSKVIGHKKCNLLYLQTKYSIKALKVIEKNELLRYNVRIV